MRRGALGLVFATVLVVLCPRAGAQIVRWTDDRGEVHITEGLDGVPERYRGGAEVLSRARPAEPDGDARDPKVAGTVSIARGTTAIRFQAGKPIMATARINGSAVVLLMVDTGASTTVLSSSVIRALGVNLGEAPIMPMSGVGGMRLARLVVLDRLEVDGAVVAPFRVAVLDGGLPAQGLLGRDFLRHFSMSVDNSAGILTLWAR